MEDSSDQDHSIGEMIFKYFHGCFMGGDVVQNERTNEIVSILDLYPTNLITKSTVVECYDKLGKTGVSNNVLFSADVKNLCEKYELTDQFENLLAIISLFYTFISIGYMQTGKTNMDEDVSKTDLRKYSNRLSEMQKLKELIHDFRMKDLLPNVPLNPKFHTIESISFKTNDGYINVHEAENINILLKAIMKGGFPHLRRSSEAAKDKYYYTDRHKAVIGLKNFLHDNTHFKAPNPIDETSITDEACRFIYTFLQISKAIRDNKTDGHSDIPKYIKSILRKQV